MSRLTYPSRPQYFAQRFIRLLVKTCVAQSLGQDVFSLLVVIVTTEDATRYRRAVNFHVSQLLPILGFAKWERLDKARRRAVDAGWLHYCPPPIGARQPGHYWVDIPSDVDGLPDTPVDEECDDFAVGYARGYDDGRAGRPAEPHPSQGDCRQKPYPPNGDGSGEAYPADGYCEGDRQGDRQGDLPYPTPNPNTSFDQFWNAVPNKVGKQASRTAFTKAAKRVSAERELSSPDAEQFIIERMSVFAKSPKAQGDYCPHPATWLNQGRYDDDPATWGNGNGKSNGQAKDDYEGVPVS